jgi:hypothetical protein
MRIRRRKSRREQATELLGTYLKVKAATKAGKGAKKAVKGAAVYQVAKRTPLVRRLPIILGAGVAAALGVRKLRGGHGGTSPGTA